MVNSLTKLLIQRLENGDVDLPVFDSVALKLHKEVNEGTMSSEELSNIIEKDPVLVADIIRMSNSSFFAGMDEITNLNQALVRLGMKQIASLVMSSSQKRLYSASKSSFRGELLRLWEHASAVGSASRWIACNTANRPIAEDVFVAGMLHDIGKLNLLIAIEEVMNSESILLESEDLFAMLNELHTDQGLILLDQWNMPQLYKEVLQNVDLAEYDNADIAVSIVRLADRVCTEQGLGYASGIELTAEQWESLTVPGWSDEKLEQLKCLLIE